MERGCLAEGNSFPAFETGRKFMVCSRIAAVNLSHDD